MTIKSSEISSIDELGLWKEYESSHDYRVRDEIVKRYSSLVKYVAGKVAINLPKTIEFDDLLSYGAIGLLDAIEKFDYTKGIMFKTYAITRVRGAIFDELRSIDWVPRSVRTKNRKIEAALLKLENKLGRTPNDEEIAKELGITIKELQKAYLTMHSGHVTSLNDVWYIGSDSDEMPIIDTIESSEASKPDIMLERGEVRDAIVKAIDKLPEKEKQIVVLYYYEDLTLKEIGLILGFTESRVSQLHNKAMLILRTKLGALKVDLKTT